ncbi:right-handed parallel beta-helix repeat-containing protein [Flagellimonas sp. HMM57]|uniref:right-handed parallel beta-helix repeat-containing protein n=1 Tax=unclassified Flagellimonas TaxID=2644544 RepID=UPI0013D8DFDB|nr:MULTISPECIES: right-handed parallel beta-helix repeat-containing protein [unclassified Flagellimonas]UII76129.1 right-handed parallel beta-helix repeat-containing protein [Flagellimonas sp. HMM57]
MRNLPVSIKHTHFSFLKLTLFFSLVLMLFTSCSQEDIFLDAIIQSEDEVADEGTDDGNSDGEDSTDGDANKGDFGEINSTPCAFSLDNLSPNETLVIDCTLDLNGQTTILPRDVTLQFNGGEIVNGILRFNGGTIDGKLLNHTLDIQGTAELSETNFFFYPERWDVKQGTVSQDEASANREGINYSIEQVSKLKGSVFSLDKFDAYFYGDFFTTDPKNSYESNSIKIPSNFHFKMSSNTYLRTYQTNNPAPRLIGIYKGDNVVVSGGNLIGDRYSHDYSPVKDWLDVDRNSHEFGTILSIKGGDNIEINGVIIEEGTGDGIGIGGSTIRNADGTVRPNEVLATNVRIVGCTINDCRRNNLSVIDGDGVLIENNIISDAGGIRNGISSDQASISGINPQFGIDLEAYRERDANNELIEYERVENVTIRGNKFTGNFKGDIVIFTANDVLIENNEMDNIVGGKAAFNCKILNNKIIARSSGVETSIGVGFGELIINGEDLVYNNEISGNTISGFDTAISLGGVDMKVSNNTLRDFDEGIFFKNVRNAEVHDNNMDSNRNIAWGYITINGNVRNVNVFDDIVNVTHKTINFMGLNKDYNDGNITFRNVDFKSKNNRSLYLENARFITVRDSKISFGVENVNSTGIELINNTIQ